MIKNEKYKIYFILPEGEWNELNKNIFADLYGDRRINILESRFKHRDNKLLCLVRKMYCSKKVNRIINLPFKEKWGYTLDEITFEKGIKYILIFPDTVYPVTPVYIKKLKQSFSVKCVLFLINSQTESHKKDTEPYISCMDYIYTFDHKDAQRNGYIECLNLYSKAMVMPVGNVTQDLYFIGFDKGRVNIIKRIVELAQNENIKLLIRVQDLKNKSCGKNNKYNIICNEWISYNKSLNEMVKSNCILEVLSEGQSGATLRYYEAVVYNKKLLTNNKNAINLPFYNPDYIQIFMRPEDIDWDWVKECIPVDYHYDGRFSPTRFIDKIIETDEKSTT